MRFILDIANKTNPKHECQKIIDFLSNEIATIHCIDETNNNQFHNEEEKNILSEEQIRKYNNTMKKPTNDIKEMFDSLKPSKKEQAIVWLLSPVIVLATWSVLIFICSL